MAEAKLDVDVKLPEKVDENIGRGLCILAESVGELIKLPSRALDIARTAGCTLFKPLTAYLNGGAAVIEARSFVEAQNIRREASQCKLAAHVANNLAERETMGQAIPQQIRDTDNLFAIQNAASETTDEDFLRFWANLYTEEACRPNTVSKKTVELCKVLDRQVVTILEEKIFPYCCKDFFLAVHHITVDDLSVAESYGFVVGQSIVLSSLVANSGVSMNMDKYTIICSPGYSFSLRSPVYRLSVAGQEILSVLKIKITPEQLNLSIQCLEEASRYWHLNTRDENYKFSIKPGQQIDTKFIVADETGIIYPEKWKGRTVEEYNNECLSHLDIVRK